jgi:hypothetical protein
MNYLLLRELAVTLKKVGITAAQCAFGLSRNDDDENRSKRNNFEFVRRLQSLQQSGTNTRKKFIKKL